MKIEFEKYYQPTAKQIEAHKNKSTYLLLAGALGSGKSYFLVAEVIKHAMKYAGNRIVIVRKELSVMRRTILITFFKVCPPEIIKTYNQTSLTIEFINGSVLIFMEANISIDPNLNKIRGLEIGFFAIDEANEVAFEVYQMLKSRLRWVLPDGSKPDYKGRLTSNPDNCWLIPTFIQSANEDEVYIQAITTDNYSEDSEYFQNLKEAFKDSPQMMRKYLYGDWTMIDTVNQLIPSEALEKCKDYLEEGYYTSMGIDPARFGGDRTVFIVLVNGNIELIETYEQTSTNQVVTRAIELMEKYNIHPHNVGVDAVGVGSGVIDNLHALNYDVKEFIGGAKPEDIEYDDNFQPFNLRSQAYYELRRDLMAGNIGNLTDQTLRLELASIQYEISSERTVRVVGKDAIKKVLGRSPDLADALCYANWFKTWRGVYPYFLPICGGSPD